MIEPDYSGSLFSSTTVKQVVSCESRSYGRWHGD